MATIQLRTSIPGPKSTTLADRRLRAVPRGLAHATPVYVAKAEDAVLEDVDGNRYIDFAGGIGCNNVGHRRPSVLSAIREQLDRFLHTCVQVTPYESYVRLAERMNELTPGKFPKKTLFVNSGAEAIENAVKIARAHTGRSGIIAFEDAFHGRTMMTLALTSKTHPYKAGFAPFPGDVYRIPYAYCYRCSYSLTYPSCDLFCARHLEDTFKRVVASEDVAAVIAEPVLGEGGFVAPPPDYFRVLIDICHKHGVLFIADEVQTGFGRTGALFASEHYGIEPDIFVTAKSLGGGLPLAAITGRAEIMDAPQPGGLGGTFGGNPLSCAAALAVLDAFENENESLSARANELGNRFQRRALDWQRRWPVIGDVRGLGAMQAMELVQSADTRLPAADETKQIVQDCYEHGLIILSAGSYSNVIRALMPLVITDAQMDEALVVLESALQTVCERKEAAAQPV
ncbi:MAG: 4-aminobutyrate--2-oxoglutarate transaminase [Acidobacteria bacterium]|jgi:4-aminobutyrate aminotransferase/(S)-3-amino-2-methylpropionate transaminase|nr:MAG: 4-aminobutyrate transaminase [Acidobacteriales bacterium 13_1_40CM_3_55_5]PYX04200.1 MAG: 4-aminobutyrate--2-oxoglutarate transaminase [Acidobacteriota bacterium]